MATATSAEGRLRTARPAEATEIHTRILRLALGIEESRSYWENVDPSVPASARALIAFEHRWFGSKSLERARFLLSNFADRYDAVPGALEVLRRWKTMDAPTRQIVCHFHLQLSDPLYRRFTGQLLVERRAVRDARVTRDVALRWLKTEFADRWSEATLIQFASKLLSAASEAGVLSNAWGGSVRAGGVRALSPAVPKVPDVALAYWMHLLRGIGFSGTLTDNPYFASVGLVPGAIEARLRALDGLTFRRMGELTEFEWDAPDLATWAEGALS